jgi:hypothetical protein
MRLSLLFITIFFCTVLANAQANPNLEAEYNGLFANAVSETNADFPFVFTVTTKFMKNGKTVQTVTERDEREAELHERITRTTATSKGTETQYQISVGDANTFCSKDGKIWIASQYECFGPVNFYGREQPLSVERTITEKTVNGKSLKVLREITLLSPLNGKGKKRFREKISTLDSRGFFVSVIDTEGTLDPKTVTLIRKQLWTKESFDPITAPRSK